MASLSGQLSKTQVRVKKQTLQVYDKLNNRDFKFKVHPWTSIKEIKEKLHKEISIPVNQQRLFFKNIELSNNKSLNDYGLLNDECDRVLFSTMPTFEGQRAGIDVYGTLETSEYMDKLVQEVRQGFQVGLAPNLTMDGTGATYMLRNSKKKVKAMFKPIDEEAFAPNNPRGYKGKFGQETFKKGILSGEACIREVAAYLLDKDHFAAVPPTSFVEAMHPSFSYSGAIDDNTDPFAFKEAVSALINPVMSGQSTEDSSVTALTKEKPVYSKFGSLQLFVEADDVAGNLSSDLFSTEEVHKIAILDIRVLNTDRNDANILVTKKKKKSGDAEYFLIPIDHGMSVPDCLEINPFDWCWMDWRQAKEPFSQRTLDYIKKINVVKDVEFLNKTFHFRKDCLRNLRISGTLLKKSAQAGLTLEDICQLMCRSDFDEKPSLLENIVEKAVSITNSIRKMKKPVLALGNEKNFINKAINERRNSNFSPVSNERRKASPKETTLKNSSNDEEESKTPKLEKRKRAFSENETDLMFSMSVSQVENQFGKNLQPIFKNMSANPSEEPVLSNEHSNIVTSEEMVLEYEADPILTESDEDKESLKNEGDDEERNADRGGIPPLKRTASLPELVVNRKSKSGPGFEDVKEVPEDQECDLKDMKVKSRTKKILQLKKKLSHHKEEDEVILNTAFDEEFFYYFGFYLDQAIKKIANAKKSKNPLTGRFRSMSNLDI